MGHLTKLASLFLFVCMPIMSMACHQFGVAKGASKAKGQPMGPSRNSEQASAGRSGIIYDYGRSPSADQLAYALVDQTNSQDGCLFNMHLFWVQGFPQHRVSRYETDCCLEDVRYLEFPAYWRDDETLMVACPVPSQLEYEYASYRWIDGQVAKLPAEIVQGGNVQVQRKVVVSSGHVEGLESVYIHEKTTGQMLYKRIGLDHEICLEDYVVADSADGRVRVFPRTGSMQPPESCSSEMCPCEPFACFTSSTRKSGPEFAEWNPDRGEFLCKRIGPSDSENPR